MGEPLSKVHMVLVAAVVTVVMVFLAVYALTGEPDRDDGLEKVTFRTEGVDVLDVRCEVADTSYERAEGLQHREDLPQGRGMLFVYPDPKEVSYIMPNMNFPLDIIFIAENGTVVNVEEAEPEDPDTPRADYVRYRSDGPIKWVVEINQGLSRQHGIGPGTQVVFYD